MPWRTDRQIIADTLARHVRDGRKSWVEAVCICGERGMSFEQHRDHIAGAVVEALGEADRLRGASDG